MDYLNIRYQKIYFKIQFTESAELPMYKVSMIRGGIGEMLLRGNCISDRQCEKCSFQNECVVERIYYHPMKIVPSYVGKENVGYLYECMDKRTYVEAGDIMTFCLCLFGDVVIHFPAVLQAVYSLGQTGMGINHAHYHIIEVITHRRKKVVQGNQVYLHNMAPEIIADYTDYRIKQNSGNEFEIIFLTPWTQKYEKEFIKEMHPEAFIRAVYRRIYLLNCMEGIEMEEQCPYEGTIQLLEQKSYNVTVPRYSNRQNTKIYLHGIQGEMRVRIENMELLRFILAGELLHIGKNSSMGFGQYRIWAVPDS